MSEGGVEGTERGHVATADSFSDELSHLRCEVALAKRDFSDVPHGASPDHALRRQLLK
jgi:hypothetical protein